MSEDDARELQRLSDQAAQIRRSREAIAPDEVCRNCGSRIFRFDGETWTHGNGSKWCDPQQAQPMDGLVLANASPVDVTGLAEWNALVVALAARKFGYEHTVAERFNSDSVIANAALHLVRAATEEPETTEPDATGGRG